MRSSNKLGLVIASIALVVIVACGGGAEEDPAAETVAVAVADSPASTVGAVSPDSASSPEIQPNRLIKLVDALDDPDHYCIDIRGFGSGVRLNDSLQAHTCKPNDNRDEQFTFNSSTGQISTEEYDLCMQPESLTDGANIYLNDCSSTSLQAFTSQADGTIRLGTTGNSGLCIAVAAGEGFRINAIHKRRELYVRTCDDTDTSLMTWSFASGGVTPESRSSMLSGTPLRSLPAVTGNYVCSHVILVQLDSQTGAV